MTSHSHDPLPSDPNYAAHITELCEIIFELVGEYLTKVIERYKTKFIRGF